MIEREIHIHYREYGSVEELGPEDRELAAEAILAMENAYAPYSHYHVGAAVRLDDGTIVRGSNQENAAFPSGLCAERTAMFAASALYPGREMVSIALVGGAGGKLSAEPDTPCGACRQVMAQYQVRSGKPVSVIMVSADKVWKFEKVDDILPLIFDGI